MGVEYLKPKQEMVDLVDEIRAEFHQHLKPFRIGVIMWDGERKKGDKALLGKAGKVPDRIKPLLVDDQLDALIEFSWDFWQLAKPYQRRALVDHELCHLVTDDNGNLRVTGHNLEEFNAVIHRHGFWLDDVKQTAKVIQHRLDFGEKLGGVYGIDPKMGSGEVYQ